VDQEFLEVVEVRVKSVPPAFSVKNFDLFDCKLLELVLHD
jgi:hypothetical protein